jgi:sugar-specific transcriptional regulator TrmB
MNPLIKDELQRRIEELKKLSANALENLPKQQEEEITIDGKNLSMVIWHDILNSQEHMVVVQIYEKNILGLGHMYADGFVVSIDGKIRPISNEEWYQFS